MRSLIVTIVLFVNMLLFAQDYSFKNYSVDDGLSQSQVTAICQDTGGYIWFGTHSGGINRFDGKNFKIYNTKKGLLDNSVFCITLDKRGRLWIGTAKGVSVFDGMIFKNYDSRHGFSRVNNIIEDKHGHIWLTDFDNGLFRFNGTSFTRFTEKDGLASNHTRSITLDKSGNLWIATSNGVSVYNGTSFTNYTIKQGLKEDYTRAILCDKKGAIWFGHRNGISRFDRKGFNYYSERNGLSDNDVHNIYEDSKGNIWFSTNEGLDRFDGNNFFHVKTSDDFLNKRIWTIIEDREENLWVGTDARGASRLRSTNFTHYGPGEGLMSNTVWAILEDKPGSVWFGTDKAGIIRFNGKSFSSASLKNLMGTDVVYSLLQDKKGNIWIGTDNGLALYSRGRFINCSKNAIPKNSSILVVYQDRKSNLWLGTFNGLIKYDGHSFTQYLIDSLSTIAVYCILEDDSGKLWLCTEKDGVKIFNGHSFKNFPIEDARFDSKIWSIAQDKYNNIWLGHSEAGLIRYTPSTNKFLYLTKEDGLITDEIVSLVVDKKDIMWIGTNIGISRFDLTKFNSTGLKDFRNYGKNEGFIGVECNQNALYIDSKENVWFGTIKGISKYDPHGRFEIFTKTKPLAQITSVQLFMGNGNLHQYADSIEHSSGLPVNLKLPHNKNYLNFSFASMSFKNPEKVFFRYKLEGIDRDWSPVTTSNSVTYQDLRPGSYRFLVTACNDEMIWSDKPASFSFVISAPFWLTWWFSLLIVILFMSLIYLYIMLRTKKLERQKEELEKLTKERTAELQEEKEKVEKINYQLAQINSELANANNRLELNNNELEKLSIVARETGNSIYIFDCNGNIEWINSGNTRMNGYSLEELIEKRGRNITTISSHPSISMMIEKCIREKQSIRYETINIAKGSKTYWGASTLTPIFDDQGQLRKLVIIETDISDQKRIEAELQKAHDELEKRVTERTAELIASNEQLKKEISIRKWTEEELIIAKDKAEHADRLKSAFLAQMSHEIRTPLNVILSYTSLLKEELSGRFDSVLETVFYGIQNAGQRLIRTIDLILNMSAVQSGTHDINPKCFSLSEKLQNMMIEFCSLAKARGLDLSFINETCIGEIKADEYTVEQIFQNLIDNAIKFTKSGSVLVKLYLNSDGIVCVDVKDDGIGISEEYLPEIFTPFSQEEVGYTRKYEGNGLGLALVAKYVEMNNAEITVKSKKGEGSCFTVKFPQ